MLACHATTTAATIVNGGASNLWAQLSPEILIQFEGDEALATIGKLSEVVAGSTGVPQSTVMQQARELRNAGILVSAGRGYGAAQMSPLDASRLLLAVACADSVKDTAQTVYELASLPAARMPQPEWSRQNFTSHLQSRTNRTLDALLGNIIQLAGTKELFPKWALSGSASVPTVRIDLFKPKLAAVARLWVADFFEGYFFGATANLALHAGDEVSARYYSEIIRPSYPDGCIVRHTAIEWETIKAVAMAISFDDEHRSLDVLK